MCRQGGRALWAGAKTCYSCLALHVAQTSVKPSQSSRCVFHVGGQRARSERLDDRRLAGRASFTGQAAETVLMWAGLLRYIWRSPACKPC